jgi:choline dehydrogenase-like flavoprotein
MGGARRPPSLVVRPYAHATRVRFARADNGGAAPSAIGVEWVEVDAEGAPLTGGAAGAALRCRVAHARREIILSAGAIHTPRLLLLSGVGPAAQLAAHGVALVADSAAVGAQLMDGVYALAQFAVPLPLRAHRRSADADGPADADADDAADAAAEVEATAAAALGLTDRPFWCDPLPFLQSVAQADKASEVSAIGTDGRSVDHTPRRAAEAQTEAASGDDGGDAGVRATTPAAAMWCTEQLSAYLVRL